MKPGKRPSHTVVQFRSAVSGLWYRDPGAAGDIDAVKLWTMQVDLPEGAEILDGPDEIREGDLVAVFGRNEWVPVKRKDWGSPSWIYAAVCRPPSKETPQSDGKED